MQLPLCIPAVKSSSLDSCQLHSCSKPFSNLLPLWRLLILNFLLKTTFLFSAKWATRKSHVRQMRADSELTKLTKAGFNNGMKAQLGTKHGSKWLLRRYWQEGAPDIYFLLLVFILARIKSRIRSYQVKIGWKVSSKSEGGDASPLCHFSILNHSEPAR